MRVVSAIPITGNLPAGTVSRQTPIADVLKALAESFGVQVSGHPEEPRAFVYSGPWDGVDIYPVPEEDAGTGLIASGVCSIPINATKRVEFLCRLNRAKYLAWYRENVWPMLSADAKLPSKS